MGAHLIILFICTVYMYALIPPDSWFILSRTAQNTFCPGRGSLPDLFSVIQALRLWQRCTGDAEYVFTSLRIHLFLSAWAPFTCLHTFVSPPPLCCLLLLVYSALCTDDLLFWHSNTVIFLFCMSLAELAHAVSCPAEWCIPPLSQKAPQ